MIHSSAKQSKESCFGLYPSERAWFKENIKITYNDAQTRYLRYIRGDAAVRFYDYATRFREFNEEIHRYVAEEFVKLCGAQLSYKQPIIKHHYGMPTASSIAIGTFVINVDEDDLHNRTVPIFSDYGKDICLYCVNREQEKKQTYVLAGTNSHVILVPHGWGQVIDDISHLDVTHIFDERRRQLLLTFSDSSVLKFNVTSEQRLNIKQKHIRTYNDIEEFLKKNCRYFKGATQALLHPIFCYCTKSIKPDNDK